MNAQSLSMAKFLENWFSTNLTGFVRVILLATFRHESLVLDIGACEVTSVQSEDILLELATVVRNAISMEMKKRRDFSRRHLQSVKFYSPSGIEVSTKYFCDLTIKLDLNGELSILVRECHCSSLLEIEKVANERMSQINRSLFFIGLGTWW